ncbi:hypothetical protein [Streptomyces sp. NPDC058622]|uniref:hypothetical protein n=1 Tax=Streptomyces sp. NPDC058622 TaxID=3346562 RepID=UPI00364789B7
MGDELHGRADRVGAPGGVGDESELDERYVSVPVLDASDPLVLGPEPCEERRAPCVLVLVLVLVLRFERLRQVGPEEPQVLVRADLLEAAGDRAAQRPAVQVRVLARGETAPDRGVHPLGLVGEDVPCRDPVQSPLDYLFVGVHGRSRWATGHRADNSVLPGRDPPGRTVRRSSPWAG